MRFAITYIVICFAFIGPALAGDYYVGYAAFKQKDYYNAYREWSELAAKGDKRAQYRLGEMFRSGTGLPVVKKVAVALYISAADQGHKNSVRRLKSMADAGNPAAGNWISKNLKKVAEVRPAPRDAAKAAKSVQAEEEASTSSGDLGDLGDLDFLKHLMK